MEIGKTQGEYNKAEIRERCVSKSYWQGGGGGGGEQEDGDLYSATSAVTGRERERGGEGGGDLHTSGGKDMG